MRISLCGLILAGVWMAPQPVAADNGLQDVIAQHAAVGDDDLARQLGQGGTMNVDLLQLNQMDTQAQLDGNVVNSSISGDNFVGNGVFSNSQGFATVIQNSGNNVIIQSPTIINFSMQR